MTAVENFAKIKQPKPVVENNNNNNKEVKRQYNMPSVGVITPPKISASPIADALIYTQNEHPQIKYRSKFKKYKFLTPQCAMFLGIMATGILSVVKLFKK